VEFIATPSRDNGNRVSAIGVKFTPPALTSKFILLSYGRYIRPNRKTPADTLDSFGGTPFRTKPAIWLAKIASSPFTQPQALSRRSMRGANRWYKILADCSQIASQALCSSLSRHRHETCGCQVRDGSRRKIKTHGENL
jgi:hypothetical protein